MMFYKPAIKTHIKIIGTTNFNIILKTMPQKVFPNNFCHNDFTNQPANIQINKVLKGNSIFEVT